MLKMKNIMVSLLLASLLALPACKKSEPPPLAGTMTMFDINVELPRLEQEFQSASPELQSAVIEIKMKCRRWQLSEMLVDLDKLANNPSLSESQKKAVSDISGEVKQVLEKKTNPAGK